MVSNEFEQEFWRLFHSAIRHSGAPEEMDRAEGVIDWLQLNSVTIRKCCLDDELVLLGVVYNYARANKTLPTFNSVMDELGKLDKTQAIVEALEVYKDLRSGLTIYDAAGLGQVLADKVALFERVRFAYYLHVTTGINAGRNRTDKARGITYAGTKGAVNFLMTKMEEGVLIDQSGVVRPIIVQQEASEIGSRYDYLKNRGHLDTDIDELPLFAGSFLGVLGYAGGGKSTFSRFLAYQLALRGRHVYHVSLENDSEIESDKYVLLHCHHPKWGGEFRSVTYAKFLHGTLTQTEREALDIVAADFRETVAGRITITQPQNATWESIKASVELHAGRQPLDVLFLDYIQLLAPQGLRNGEDGRQAMTAIIKDIRQFGLTCPTQSGAKLVIISPIQSNESGREKAEALDGIWSLAGVNDVKELSRSCDKIVGVFSFENRDMQGRRECMLSCVKDRNGIGFAPTQYFLSDAGWVTTKAKTLVFPDSVTMDDIVDQELA